MKRLILLVTFIFFGIFFTACDTKSEHPDVVTTMFVHYDIVRQLADDYLTVELLIPLGADVHSFEATSKDIVKIKNAKLFLFTSLELDTWIQDEKTIGGDQTVVVNMSQSYVLDLESVDEHDELHYWVDPIIFTQMVDYVLDHLLLIDPEHADHYQRNANLYKQQVLDLHNDFITSSLSQSTLYFAGHNAFGLFGLRYDLTFVSLFPEFKPDDDLTSQEIISFSNAIREAQTTFLFSEALIEPKAAKAIQNHLRTQNYQLSLLELHTYHNVSQSDWNQKKTYVDLFAQNIDQLKQGLGVKDHD